MNQPVTYQLLGGRRLNTCTRCPLRTSSLLFYDDKLCFTVLRRSAEPRLSRTTPSAHALSNPPPVRVFTPTLTPLSTTIAIRMLGKGYGYSGNETEYDGYGGPRLEFNIYCLLRNQDARFLKYEALSISSFEFRLPVSHCRPTL